MAYDNEKYIKIEELQEVYRKAKAFDEISKYVKRKLSAEVPLDDDYLIGRFDSYETIQEFMERADDERCKNTDSKNDSINKYLDRFDDDNIMG